MMRLTFVLVAGLAAAPAAAQERPLAGTPTEPPAVDLGIDAAVERALERNLDIAVERLNPRVFDLSLAALRATYRPAFTSQVGWRDATQFTRSQISGAPVLTTETLTANTGLTQALPWGGGSLSVTFNNSRLNQSDQFAIRNPTLNTNLTATFVQPLLRGFLIDSTRAQLRITRINQSISESQLKSTIVATLAQVRNAYWDLVYAIEAVEVARRSLDLATKLVQDNRMRVEIGTMAPIDVIQAEAEEASRRQVLAQAEAARRTAELALKRLIVSGTDDPLWSARINPVDRPPFDPQPVDVEAAIRRALAERLDLEQAKRQIEGSLVSLDLLRNQTLPAVDLVASYGVQGIGGPQFVRGGLGGAITAVIPGGYQDALRTLLRQDAPTWNVQLNVSYPIGTSAAEANAARARLQLQQAQAQLKALQLQVATEVTNAALQVQSNLQRVEAARAARELAEKRLEAEMSKFEVGMSTNYFIVQAQRDLADAQNIELRAR
ncbi:MAG TPA: TolC family protein, partial [Vicinamibacterales bacterium]|nr:TolC family protein [Vicinamibacterales bacterium]